MISFVCTCGQRLQVAEPWAGSSVRCPVCRAVLTAPAVTSDAPTDEQPTWSGSQDKTLTPSNPIRKPAKKDPGKDP